MSAKPIWWCLIAAALFGVSTPAAKALLGDVSALSLAGLLYLGAALFTAPFAFRGGSRSARRHPANLLRLLSAVVFGGVLGPVLMLLALSSARASDVALWLNLETVTTAVLGVSLFREPLGRRGWLSVGLVTAGSVLLAWRGGGTFAFEGALAALACLAWGVDNHLTARIDGFTPAQSTCVKGLVAGLVNIGLGFVVVTETGLARDVILLALLLGALSYGASLVLYVSAAQQLGATRSQMVFASAPFFGAALAWTAGGERVLPLQLVAAALMVLGLVLTARERHGHAHTHEERTHTHWHRHDDLHHDHAHERLPWLGWHAHEHHHAAMQHSHGHRPDLHHRHEHG